MATGMKMAVFYGVAPCTMANAEHPTEAIFIFDELPFPNTGNHG
jgi:hypothetical protein